MHPDEAHYQLCREFMATRENMGAREFRQAWEAYVAENRAELERRAEEMIA